MDYDPIRSTVLATTEELDQLSRLINDGLDLTDTETWRQAGFLETEAVSDGQATVLVHPVLAGIAMLVARPTRSVIVERFAEGLVAVLFVSWDQSGRAIVTEGTDDDRLLITATQLKLLPGLLSQSLRINPDAPTSPMQKVTTTAADIGSLFDAGAPASGDDGIGFMADISHGFRASASNPNASLTVFYSVTEGFWSVRHGDQVAGATVSPKTKVTLEPLSPGDVLGRLGDVITGRGGSSD